MNTNDVASMLYSVLIFISALSGMLNVYYLGRLRGMDNECKRLKEENRQYMSELNDLYNEKPFLKSDDPRSKQ